MPKKLLISKIIKNRRQTAKEAIVEWLYIIKRFRLLIPLFIVSSASYGLTISYLPLFLDENTSLSLSSIGLIIALWIGIGVIAGLLYNKIQTYLSRKILIILSYITMGFMGFSISITTSAQLIIIFVISLGLSTFLSFPALFSFISEATHENVEGKTFGYIFTIQLGVGTFFLFLSGVLADIFGIWIPFSLLGFIGVFVTILLLIKRKSLYVFN
jgi:MFS family permease